MRIGYFECHAGASGNMILGVLVDAGVELAWLNREVQKLGLPHVALKADKVTRGGIAGTHITVEADETHHPPPHRHLSHIEQLIAQSALSPAVKAQSIAVFKRLANAEAAVHRIDIEQVHFHEVGAVDAIVDVVGAVAGLAHLNLEHLYSSPLHLGTGTVTCAHGTLPVPAPATAELVKGWPVYGGEVATELLTPTGAAILTTLAHPISSLPAMQPEAIGYGAGSAQLPIPNLLRLFIGNATGTEAHFDHETMGVVETTIDDMNPQIYAHLFETLPGQGAVDIFLTPVQMKQNRPGTLVTVLCPPSRVGAVADHLMQETTTIGIRWRTDHRIIARREIRAVPTPFGPVSVKLAFRGTTPINATPEYRQCLEIARTRQVPLKTVMEAARRAAAELMPPPSKADRPLA